MKAPKVSICIPAYNQVEYLRRTLKSFVAQTYQDFEIIVTDDSPNESVKDLVSTFDFGGRLIYRKNRRRLGTPENWNEAVRQATGEYIKILHHDDWFTEKSSLYEFVKLLDDNPEANLGFSATLVWRVDDDTKRIHRATPEQLEMLSRNPENLFFGNFIGAPSATIYRSVVGQDYDTRMQWHVDVDFYIRVLRQNSNFAFTARPLVCTPDGAEHQVTRFCLKSKEIELFEGAYLLGKIQPCDLDVNRLASYWTRLFLKYNVKSVKEFKRLGIALPMPRHFFYRVLLVSLLLKLRSQCSKSIKAILSRI